MIVPIVLLSVLLYGIVRKVSVFDVFVNGAKDGLKTIYNITPTLVGLIVSVSMLKGSGALDILTTFLSPVTGFLHFPSELLPMAILRPVSGGGSTALLNQVFKDYGPDSFVGRCASVIAGSTETTFYAITVYFGSVNVKKIRHTLFSALMADITAAAMAVIIVSLVF